ncbi:HAD-like protein [Amniculicola lignicola CBS 123094]|uniref:HAD-like protein n=1 Tax=Amniculicola lignicola CBS 123094 TaxID=1392246 RepID=A0A6A5WM55_9PLEO|nr:HAD-like protein [Amniculicola lignicola CBS 123094]
MPPHAHDRASSRELQAPPNFTPINPSDAPVMKRGGQERPDLTASAQRPPTRRRQFTQNYSRKASESSIRPATSTAQNGSEPEAPISLQSLTESLPRQTNTIPVDSPNADNTPTLNPLTVPTNHGYQPHASSHRYQAPAGHAYPRMGNLPTNNGYAGHSIPSPYPAYYGYAPNPYAAYYGNALNPYAAYTGNPSNYTGYDGSGLNHQAAHYGNAFAYHGNAHHFGGYPPYASAAYAYPGFSHQPVSGLHGDPAGALPHPGLAPPTNPNSTPPANKPDTVPHGNHPVPAPSDSQPVAASCDDKPVAAPSDDKPVAAPSGDRLVAAPSGNKPVTAHSVNPPRSVLHGLPPSAIPRRSRLDIIAPPTVATPPPPPKSQQTPLSTKQERNALPVPKPSKNYIRMSNLKAIVQESPSRKLVILDLNGTLVFRDGGKRNKVVARPCLRPFMKYLFDNFSVMIWSSATPKNVSKTVDKLFDTTNISKLIGVWSRDRFGLTQRQYETKIQVYKELTMVWADKEIQDQAPPGGWDQSNTILIDDTMEKAVAQPYNHVQLLEYTGSRDADWTLRSVAAYLEAVRKQKNVSAFMRVTPYHSTAGEWMAAWEDDWEKSVAVEVQKPTDY